MLRVSPGSVLHPLVLRGPYGAGCGTRLSNMQEKYNASCASPQAWGMSLVSFHKSCASKRPLLQLIPESRKQNWMQAAQ